MCTTCIFTARVPLSCAPTLGVGAPVGTTRFTAPFTVCGALGALTFCACICQRTIASSISSIPTPRVSAPDATTIRIKVTKQVVHPGAPGRKVGAQAVAQTRESFTLIPRRRLGECLVHRAVRGRCTSSAQVAQSSVFLPSCLGTSRRRHFGFASPSRKPGTMQHVPHHWRPTNGD